MLPIIDMFGIEIPSYALFATIGMVFALFVAVKAGVRMGFLKTDIFLAFGYGSFGMVVGAKIFFALPFLPEIFSVLKEQGFSYLQQHQRELILNIFSGYVFYGGLIGMIVGICIYAMLRKLPKLPLLDILAICVPLFHGFGRIGCFFAGCCYGEIGRVPVQLVESGCNFVLFFILIYYRRKQSKAGRLFGMYLSCYSVLRFLLEFFREDEIRGVFEIGMFECSMSQIVSLVIFVCNNSAIMRNEWTRRLRDD